MNEQPDIKNLIRLKNLTYVYIYITCTYSNTCLCVHMLTYVVFNRSVFFCSFAKYVSVEILTFVSIVRHSSKY